MIPILYDRNATYSRFLGKGKLIDTISCTVHEELNGDYSLELEYPVTGKMLADLYGGGVIAALVDAQEKTTGGHVEFFDIYKHSVPIDGVITFFAYHVSRRLAEHVYRLTTINGNINGGDVFNGSAPQITAQTGEVSFTLYNSSGFTGSVSLDAPISALAALIGDGVSWASQFGGETSFKCATVGNNDDATPQCQITLAASVGKDRNVKIRYGYDLTQLQYEEDSSETYNALVPYWDDGNGNKTYVTGYVVQPTTPITPVKAVPMDCTQAFENQPTGAELAQYAQDWLDANTPWVNVETIEADFVNGAEVFPNAAPVRIGDTVTVCFPQAGIEKQMKVIAADYDVIAEAFTKLKLGKQQTNFVSVTGIDGGSGASGTASADAEYYKSGETLILDGLTVPCWSNSSGAAGVAGIILPKKVNTTPTVTATATIEAYGTGGGRMATITSYSFSGNVLTLILQYTTNFTAGLSVCLRFNGIKITF